MNGNSDTMNGQRDDLLVATKDPNSNFVAPILPKTSSWLVRSKLVSPEFSNTEDEAELGKMIGDDGEKLLALVDDIRKIDSLRNEELHIPQIVVIGDTSTGKSSVLQALTRLPFPVAGELCTRFITETTIRRCSPSERPGYEIEVKTESDNTFQNSPFPPRSFESDEWVEVYQNLREDIKDAFEKLSPINNEAKQGVKSTGSRASPKPQLLKYRLHITVHKPNQAHFSIVDIPGLVSSGATADIQLSEQLARQYIKNEEAIVLAITPASNVLANQRWLNLVEDEQALDRTIGVITKPDRIEEADHENIFNLLRNQAGSEHYLKLGWFAVRNRSSQEIRDGELFKERDRKEDEFFTGSKWGDATRNFPAGGSIDPEVLGIRRLKHTLQDHLYRRVKESFPRLRAKMSSLEKEYNTKIQSMGEPRESPRDQRVYLSGIQTTYEAEVQRSLNGDYRFVNNPKHSSRLRYHVKKLNDAFENAMQYNGIRYKWQDGDIDEFGGIFNWIGETWDAHRGSEPRHDAPRSLKKELVSQQTESWEPKSISYIQQVEDAVKACNDDLFMFACKDDALCLKIREKLEERETKAFEDAKAELRNILNDRDYIDSYNPQFEIFIQEFQIPRMQRQENSHLVQYMKNGSATEENLAEVSFDQVSARREFYINNKKIYEVHDWLHAYWKVAYPRFVDNIIIQVTERHLLGPNGPLRLFDRNWIFLLEPEELEELVGENERTRSARRELKERLHGLKDALGRVDIALRSRTDG